MYVAFGGALTFKNAKKTPDVAREVPADRLLLETDCPYMAPVPFRGKRNTSALIPYAAETIARLRGEETQTLTFSWYVDDPTGDIYIRYDGTGKTFVLDASSTQNGFYLDSDYFNGCMIGVGTSNDDIIDFDFTRYTYAREGKLQAPKKAKTSARRKGADSNTHDIPWKLVKR